MYRQKLKLTKKTLLLAVPLLLALPFLIAFDSLVYFLTRPACLTCGNLLEFLQTASLSVFLVGGVMGYKLKKK